MYPQGYMHPLGTCIPWDTLRVCIKARWVGPYVFNRIMADLRSPTSLKDVLLVNMSLQMNNAHSRWSREHFPMVAGGKNK